MADSARGQGVGTQLLEVVKTEAAERGCSRLLLLNRRNRHSYERDFYQNESRYLTTLEMMEEISRMEDPFKIFFGRNMYVSGYEEGERPDRILHADHNVLLDGTGIFGLTLYLIIYIVILRMIVALPRTRDPVLNRYKSFAVSLIVMSLFVSLNGSLFLVSFRVTIFLYLGAILGMLYRTLGTSRKTLPAKSLVRPQLAGK